MKNIWEVFKEFQDAPTNQKINVLRKNNTPTLRNVLQGAFHPGVQYVIKELPEYKRSDAPAGLGYTSIELEMGRMYIFTEGSKRVDPNLKLARKKVILAQIMEALEPNEADVFGRMILKDLKVPGLTYEVVEEAFPDLLPAR